MQHLILTEQMIGQEYAAKKVEGLDEQYVKSCAINVYLTENGWAQCESFTNGSF